jgi:nucleotide-binding universal stress UspA family protein
MLFHQVLVPTDGSENSVKAAQLAFRIANLCNAAISLIYVVDSGVLNELSRFAEHQKSEVRTELYQNGRQYLEFLTTLARHEQLEVQQHLREGAPSEEIIAAAGELRVDLIVMGHVGRRGPRRILIGSVTERVIEFATCPVLVVKP